MRRRRRDGGESTVRRRGSERETLSAVVGALMPGVNLAFFTLAGASLHLSSVWRSSFAAWAVVGARLFALYHAARAGCDLVGAPVEHREVAWMGYVTQAGVALGLARTAALGFRSGGKISERSRWRWWC